MTPDQLLTFAAVAELGGIGHAATALHLSQPAVSGQLRLLHESFGQPLYRREGRGIRLTEAGEQLAGIARQLRQTYQRAIDLREAMAGLQTGSLAIGASTTPASYLLPYVMADFRRRHPSVSVSLVSGNTTDIIEQLSRFDLAFIEGAVPADLPPDTSVREWQRDEVVAIVRYDHPLARNQQLERRQPSRRARLQAELPLASAGRSLPGVRLATLANHALVLREPGSGVRQQVLQAFANAGLATQVAIELAGVEGVKEGVRAGLGVGFVSAMAVQPSDPALQALRVLPPHELNRHISALIPHADALGAPARAFIEACFTPPEHASRIQS